MAKARRELSRRLKQVDFFIEVADARAPRSTRNPELDGMVSSLPRLLVLTKADVADRDAALRWAKHARSRSGIVTVVASLIQPRDVRSLGYHIQRLAEKARKRINKTGPATDIPGVVMPRFGRPKARGIVVGLPNTGKSSLIRVLGGGNLAVGNRPGVTRGVQEVAVGHDAVLLDTPGLLWPAAVKGRQALHLAWLGCAGDKAYDAEAAALQLLAWLREKAPQELVKRYGDDVERLPEGPRALGHIAMTRRRGAGGRGDPAAGADILLRDFRAGLLGRYFLDEMDCGPPIQEDKSGK